ncbi:MAG: DUF4391 domain-containing protein [Bdellovibrionales bacterium]|nr:DUF4391 domain-containing protein [Bdellovibrionales bacterium]
MTVTLFDYPKKTAFNRVLPKSKIYAYSKPSRSIRQRFVDEVDQIVWKYKLSPETLNLRATKSVPEIQVFGISLRTEEVSESVLRTIDKAISFPIFYELTFEDHLKVVAAYKRPSDADSAKWVVDTYFSSDWGNTKVVRDSLPVALSLGSLYEQMLRRLIDIEAKPGESLKKQVERIAAIRGKEAECKKLEQRLGREKQFNRKVELNRELRTCKEEINALLGAQE